MQEHFHPNRRHPGDPDFDEIISTRDLRLVDGATEPNLYLAAALLALVAGLFSLAMLAVSLNRAERPTACAPYPAAAECMAALQEAGA